MQVSRPEPCGPFLTTIFYRVIWEELTYTLVFPADAEAVQNKISVLAPIGTALIGYRVGDVITWNVPGGMRMLRVEKIIYQPEAAGDFERQPLSTHE